jgi:succinate dehydrogenase/fumarate reductase-like Fe-S protein
MEMTKLKIFRYHPDMNAPIYKDYELPFREDFSVLKALFEIGEIYDDSPAFRRYSCNRGQCASCVMAINGRNRRACTTRLAKEMTLEPAYGYPVIRDLVVDFGRKVFSPPDHYTKMMEGSLVLSPPRRKLKRERAVQISVNESPCKECQSKECLKACWLNKLENLEDRFGRRLVPGASRIEEWICAQCLDVPCAESCPTGAISMKRGMVVGINPQVCIGCWICMDHCPYGAIWMNIERGYAVKCDLCDGDPACVRVCSYGAIKILNL